MKRTSKTITLVLALVMALVMAVPAVMAEGEQTESVTLHKILMSKDDLNQKDAEGKNLFPGTTGADGVKYTGNNIDDLKGFFGRSAEEIDGVYFALKFAADYADEALKGKYVKAAADNQLTPADPLAATDNVDEAVGGLTGAVEGQVGIKFNTGKLEGKFSIVEIHEKSTYVGDNGETLTDKKAVPVEITLPLVNEQGVVADAHVYPKNVEEKPTTDKDFANGVGGSTGANADGTQREGKSKNNVDFNVGDQIPYEIKTTIPAKANYKTAFWSDRMTEGLTFDQTSLVIKVGEAELAEGDYTLNFADINGFDLKLTELGLDKINDQENAVIVTITYTATLNDKAVVDIPESNDVAFHYGNNPDHGNTPEPNKPNDEGELEVTKNWAEGVEKVEIEVQLYNAQTGEKIGDPVKLNAENGWKYKWTGLDKNIEYKVVETYVKGYSAEYGKGEAGIMTIKNHKDNNPEPINPEEPKVVTYGHRFQKYTKVNGKDTGLANAKFVIRDKDADDAKYLKAKSADQLAADQEAYAAAEKAYRDAVAAATTENPDTENIANLKKVRDAAYETAKTGWEWVDTKDQAYEFSSYEDGYFKVTGLKAGTYYLEETAAPEGYAKLSGRIPFEVKAGSKGDTTKIETGLKDDAMTRIENKKVSIPQTGGIGTVIFTVIGIALMVGALVAMKKRHNRAEA